MSRGAPPSRALAVFVALAAAAAALPLGFASGDLPAPAAIPLAVLVLQPDAPGGNDTFVVSATPDWNYGINESILVGLDAANGSVARSLLRFELSGLPASATVVNATLELFASSGARMSSTYAGRPRPGSKAAGDNRGHESPSS